MGLGADEGGAGGAGEEDSSTMYGDAFREVLALHDLDAVDEQDKTLIHLTRRLEGIKSAARDGSLKAFGE
jgi:hypothetical protein